MSRSRFQAGNINQICVEPRPNGLRAVYLVETQSEREAGDLSKFFADFAPVLDCIQLSSGKLVSYAVQLHGQDQSLLEELEGFLKKNFGFVILHRSFDQIIYDIVRELCKDSGSHLVPMHKCDICGKPEPFPETIVSFLDKDNTNLATHMYCATCTAESARRNNKEFIKSLLEADRSDFAVLRQMDMVRSRSAKKHIAFRIKSEAEHQFAVR
ncbi:MAG: hypothetical protein ACYC27_21020 [Armatimonadota bacterium]